MELTGSLYKVMSSFSSDEGQGFLVRFDPGHDIYKAHFPGEPVTPGACILQAAQELLSLSEGHPLVVENARNVKFLKIIVPFVTPEVRFLFRNMERDGEVVSAAVTVIDDEGTVYARMSLKCRTVS